MSENFQSPSSDVSYYYSTVDADDVLKSMVARKVDIQNTTMDLDSSNRIKLVEEELNSSIQLIDHSFDNFISRRSVKREIRQRQMEEMSSSFAERMNLLENQYIAGKDSEEEFIERLKVSSLKRAAELSEERKSSLSSTTSGDNRTTLDISVINNERISNCSLQQGDKY